jgi:transcriptional regulator with PAS, ATPase and Fis domain
VRQYAHVFASATGDRLGELHVLVPDRATPEVREPTELPDARTFHGIVSRDAGMLDAIETLRRVAQTEATVLVRGESGTGKELVARAIHAESRRRDGPFVAVNCGALAPSLLEDELFGHVKGAFTGADHPRPGIFAQANGGTLFLDEVAELSLELQTKLLRVLQERTFVPLGGVEPVSVDVRVVAATHRSLREQVRRGTFREDLMYRVRVVPIFLPPLRDRRVDIDLLLRHAVAAHEQRGARRIDSVAPDAMRALLDHHWPGNVRELLNVVEYAFAVGRGPQIGLGDLPPEFRERVARSPRALPDQPDDAERLRVQDALRAAGGDFGLAADRLGVSRTTFWRLRRRLGVG